MIYQDQKGWVRIGLELEDIVIESVDKFYKKWTNQTCQINNAIEIVKPYLKPELAERCERFWEGLLCLLDLGFYFFFLLSVRVHYSGHVMAKME